MHMPAAVTPLCGDYNILMGAGSPYGYQRLSVPLRGPDPDLEQLHVLRDAQRLSRVRARSRR